MPRAPVVTPPTPRPPRPWQPSSRPSTGDEDALERAALWSASFHRFFGGHYGREHLPNEVRPLSCGETSAALERIVGNRPHAVRSCLARMLASGYVPDPHNAEQFRELALQARPNGAASADDAIAALREMGMREYAAPAGPLRVPDDAPRVPVTGPTVVTFEDNVFTVEKQIALPRPYNLVRKIVEPRGWKYLGPFWPEIQERWEDWEVDRREGTIYEHFVIGWNNVAMQEYKVFLKATQRSKPGYIRTDYSLMYDEDGKLLVDDGFGQAQAMERPRGWTLYTGRKTLKFTSTLLNILSPGVMAMFLDAQVTHLPAALDRHRKRRVRH